ncbi:NAD(P)-binding protein [Xylariaceae sp. FL1019]|nr:NAD(P)-binding protein [Xylariaceae sp. FL1019]
MTPILAIMSKNNLTYILNERPEGDIIPGVTFLPKENPVPKPEDVKDGEVLAETLYLGLEPAMRTWLDETRSYVPPVGLGEVMRGFSAARVLYSKSANAKAGDIIHAPTGWAEYAIMSEKEFEPSAHFPELGHPKDLLVTMGIVGLTAWVGMTLIGKPKPGDTVVISAAAGATGSIAGQLAKIYGARVVGIAGSDDKCRWLKELGFDEALNYKDSDFSDKFNKATEKFIDVYFDSVGGEILDLALGQAAQNSRFVMCGQISAYNNPKPYAFKNLNNVILMRCNMQGFIVLDHMEHWGRARKELAGWVKEGKLKTTETIVKGGLKVAEQTLVDLYKGVNHGKLMLEIKNPAESPLEV